MFKKLTMTAAAAAMFVAGMVGQAAAGEVTLRVTGIVVDAATGATTIANFEAFVIYDTLDRSCLDQSFPCVGPGAPINILYENVTITLTVVEIPSGIVTTITKTMSQIELSDLFEVPPGDSLEINDGGNRTDPSGWSGTLFGGQITRLSWNFQDHSKTAFAGYDPDLPFAPTRTLFPDLFNGVLVLVGGASPSFGFEEIEVAVLSFVPDPTTDPYADEVAEDGINNVSCGGACAGDATDTLGPPDFEPGINTAALGGFGFVTLNFTDNFCLVDDTPAPDIIVTEANVPTLEPYSIAVGTIGGPLSAELSTAVGGIVSFDLTGLGITGFNQVRITDASNFFPGQPSNGTDIDAVECLNSVEVVATVDVDIDIKPGSDPNCFNSDGNGVIPVAILGSATFDVSDIDFITLELDGQIVAVKGKDKIMCHFEDINGDGILDLVCQIEDLDGTYVIGDGDGTLTGNLLDGTPIEGSDSICITQ